MENTILKHQYLMIKPRRRHSQSQMSENRVIPPEQEKGKRTLYMQTCMLSIDITYIWLLISSSIVYSVTHLSYTPLQTERTILGISPLCDVTQSLEWKKKSLRGTIFTYSEPDLSHTCR